MAQQQSNQAPQIRTFQFNSEAFGEIPSSVNLFRGDVNYSTDLLTLSGRNGLDVTVTALYTSNVDADVKDWNLTRPTGIIGLGWGLGGDRIVAERSGTLSPAETNYYYLGNGSRNLLIHHARPWQRLTMGLGFEVYLNSGKPEVELIAEFAANGITLSDNYESTLIANGRWHLTDYGQERSYDVRQDEDQLVVNDGGMGYDLESFEFWQIRFYPLFDRWVITKADGLIYSFGGGKRETEENRFTSEGESIEWGVRWGNWTGPSSRVFADDLTEPSLQKQFASAWNLSGITNNWGDAVKFAYRQELQRVGSEQGQAYTKAVYLETVTDVFGRTVRFNYDTKQFDIDDPYGPREYMDTHKPVPDSLPNAFQDKYETLFLDYIAVEDIDGSALFYVSFSYDLINLGRPQQGQPMGNTVKRYLTSIIQQSPAGNALPELRFDYYLDREDANPGALKTITYPSGGTATYDYEEKNLDSCLRERVISNPFGEDSRAIPRMWFGPDYAVSVWYDTDEALLSVKIYTWLGKWYEFEPHDPIAVDVNTETIQATIQDQFFALVYSERGTGEQTHIRFYHKNERALGSWMKEPFVLDFASESLSLVAGERFLLIADQVTEAIVRFTWRWDSRDWERKDFDQVDALCSPEATSDTRYYITAGRNWYVVLCYDDSGSPRHNLLQLTYLDQLGEWRAGGNCEPNEIFLASKSGYKQQLFWSAGAGFAVATYVTGFKGGSRFEYNVEIFHWDGDYTNIESKTFTYSLPETMIGAIACSVVGSGFAASGPNLLSYDGQEWQSQSLTIEQDGLETSQAVYHWFASGQDFSVMTENGGAFIDCWLGVFDPNQDAFLPSQSLARVDSKELPTSRLIRYFPTAGNDYFTLDKALYYRGFSTTWQNADAEHKIYTIPEDLDVNTTTVQNHTPDFILYEVRLNEEPHHAQVLFLHNGGDQTMGGWIDAVDLEENIFAVYENGAQRSHINGKTPSGYGSFVTYPGESWDEANSITLHRYLLGAATGPITDRRVTRIVVNDGYSDRYIFYGYDDTTATFDASGAVAKYYHVTVYPGAFDEQSASFGRVENYYVNGLPVDSPEFKGSLIFEVAQNAPDTNLAEAYSMLDGYQIQTDVYAQAETSPVESTRSLWWLYREIQVEDQGALIPIRGGYSRTKAGTKTTTGLPQSGVFEYDRSSGLKLSERTSNYNSMGIKEEAAREYTFGYQVCDSLRGLNLLDATVQTITRINDTVISVSVDTLKKFERPLSNGVMLGVYSACDTYAWRGSTPSPSFDFTECVGNSEPGPDWLLQSRILRRDARGQVTATADGLEIVTSTLYDTASRFPVASFANADYANGEAGYLGFEPGESPQGWRIAPGDESPDQWSEPGLAYTGLYSLRLPSDAEGDSALEGRFEPQKNQRYILAMWVLTVTGQPINGEAGVEIILEGATGNESSFIAFPETQSAWRYFNIVVVAGGEAGAVTFRLINRSQYSVMIDDLRFLPVECGFTGTVYEYRFDQVTAQMGPSNQTNRKIYDGFRRLVGKVGPSGEVESVSSLFSSESVNWAAEELPAPNSVIEFRARKGGVYDDFANSGPWQERWQSDDPDSWSMDGQWLVHSGEGNSEISMLATQETSEYGARVRVAVRSSELTSPLGMRIGDISAQWNPAGNLWELNDGGEVYQSPSPLLNSLSADWILCVCQQRILFYVGGAQIFSRRIDREARGAFSLFTGDDVAFADVMTFRHPIVSVSIQDGTGNVFQQQVLNESTSIVSQTLFDALARGAVGTKPAFMPDNTNNPNHSLLTYAPDFVESFNWETGEMTGYVSQYYSGGERSDDRGFPYQRALLGPSKLKRVIAVGKPGYDFAIGTGPEQTHFTRIDYSVNNGEDGFRADLPPGHYKEITSTDPNGIVTKQLSDSLGAQIAKGVLIDAENKIYNLISYEYEYRPSGKVTTLRQPNSYDPPAGSTAEDWVIINETDTLGQIVSAKNPDAESPTLYIYDKGGNLRFSRDAEGAKRGYFTYQKWDALGRLTEKGISEDEWSEEALKIIADEDDSWPQDGLWHIRNVYDGDGTDADLIGALWQRLARNGQDESPVLETFNYDARGEITRYSISIEQFGEIACQAEYVYDNLGNIERIIYPQVNESQFEVIYEYSGAGNMIRMRAGDSTLHTDADLPLLAEYTYGADAQIALANLYDGLPEPIKQSFIYDSPGWLRKMETDIFSEEIFYTSGGAGSERSGYFNGEIAAIQSDFNIPNGGEFLSSFTYSFDYDPLYRIRLALNSAASNFDIGRNYDFNGNTTEVGDAGGETSYEYWPGTDKLKSSKIGTAVEYDYDADGRAILATPSGIDAITYDRATWMPTEISRGGDGIISYYYNGAAARVAWNKGDDSHIYVLSNKGYPLLEFSAGDPGASAVRHVYGPLGRLAVCDNSGTTYILADHEGSARAFVREAEVVAAYNYTTFGDRMGPSYGTGAPALYLYTGQEFDSVTSLYNYRARLYDPRIGRFITPDPDVSYGPGSANPYAYVLDDPEIYTDPTGRIPSAVVITIGIGLGATAGLVTGILDVFQNGKSGMSMAGTIVADVLIGAAAGFMITAAPIAAAGAATALGAATGFSGLLMGMATTSSGSALVTIGSALSTASTAIGIGTAVVATPLIAGGESALFATVAGDSGEEIGMAALGGAAAGLTGVLAGEILGFGGGLISRRISKSWTSLNKKKALKHSTSLLAGLTAGLIGVGAEVGVEKALTGEIDTTELAAGSAVSGIIGGVEGTMAAMKPEGKAESGAPSESTPLLSGRRGRSGTMLRRFV